MGSEMCIRDRVQEVKGYPELVVTPDQAEPQVQVEVQVLVEAPVEVAVKGYLE